MIIPDNLSPFPVLPQTIDSAKPPRIEIESFVCEDKIHEILVGPIMVTPLVTTRVPIEDGYAGRNDLSVSDDFPFVTLSSDEAYVDEASVEKPSVKYEAGGPHPALADPRHVAPPVPRVKPDGSRGRRYTSDRWWVLGMGIALLAIFGSGTLIELISNEAVRRARIPPIADQVESPGMLADGEKRSDLQPLAASNPEYPAP